MNQVDPVQKEQTKHTDHLVEKSKEAAQSVGDFAQRASAKTSAVVDEKTTQLGGALSTVAGKSQSLKDRMETGYRDSVSPALETAHHQLEDASSYLQQSSPSDMIEDLIHTGRKNPRAAAGILFGIGFLLARKLYR